MSYQVIARKYRPQRFADVVGQEHVTQTLANAIQQQRIAHAYLFVGPRGTGKTTIARIFAKCLNSSDGPRVDFSEQDPRCAEISEGRSLDVLEIDGASNRGIEEIRALRETVKFAPAAARFKIYIIDEVHMLTKEAFNALLKTLEEPPAHVKFMFATTEPDKVLPTILSRCQRFDLRRIPAPLIARHLAFIAQAEQVTLEEAALSAIARGAEGCMRDAESALDQLISFCGPRILEADVLSMFSLAGRAQIHALAAALLGGDPNLVLRGLHDLAQQGKDISRLLTDLLHHFRNLLFYQIAKGDTSLLEVSEADGEALKAQSTRVSTESLTRMLEALTEAEGRLRYAPSKRVFLEVALLKAAQAGTRPSLEAVLGQLQQLREATGPNPLESPPSPAPAGVAGRRTPPRHASPASTLSPSTPMAAGSSPVPAASDTPAGVSSSEAAGLDLGSAWDRILEAVGKTSAFVKTYLTHGRLVSLEAKRCVIGFAPEYADQLQLVDNPKNRAMIQAALRGMGIEEPQISLVQTAEPNSSGPEVAAHPEPRSAPPAKPAPLKAPLSSAGEPAGGKPEIKAAALRDEFKNDPLIQRALEIFKGQLVEVRS